MKSGNVSLFLAATIFWVQFGCVSSDPLGSDGEIVRILDYVCPANLENGAKDAYGIIRVKLKIRNTSSDTIGILLFSSDRRDFIIPNDPPPLKPCVVSGTHVGFSVKKNGAKIFLESKRGEKHIIILPHSDTINYLAVSGANAPWKNMTDEEIISTLCSGELSYNSPCDSITRNYFGEQVRWVKEISIASSFNETQIQE